MSMDKYKLKLSRNNDKNKETPRYSLTYKPGARSVSYVCHDILSAMIGEHDVMIELSTDLLFGPRGKERAYVAAFLNRINDFRVAVLYRSVPSDRKNMIFGVPIDKRKKEMADEVVAYVPNTVWREASFADIIPIYGARYYVWKEPLDAETAVNEFWEMGEDEKACAFNLIIFDIAAIGQAGIDTKLGEETLRRMLGL